MRDARNTMMEQMESMRNYELRRMLVNRAQELDKASRPAFGMDRTKSECTFRKRAFEARKAARDAVTDD